MISKGTPGMSGDEVGGIKTPMHSSNVGRGNTPGTEKFKKAGGDTSTSGGSSIKGPGAKATPWPGEPSTGGSNLEY